MSGLFFVIAGIFTMIASQNDWEWYWNLSRARIWIDWFGKDGAKTALTILGFIITMGGLISMVTGTG